MMKLTAATLAFIAAGTLAMAAGSHSGGHDHSDDHGDGHGHDEAMAVGQPGDPSKVDRVIEVKMLETDDGDMLFEPNKFSFVEGETIQFNVENIGETDHEFVMDTPENNEKHRELMMKFPEMEHDDPNSVRLEPGEKGEIVWTFANPGEFNFACLIPGHMELGMHGPISVAAK